MCLCMSMRAQRTMHICMCVCAGACLGVYVCAYTDADDVDDGDVDDDVDATGPRSSGRLEARRGDRSDYFVSGSPQDTEKIQ